MNIEPRDVGDVRFLDCAGRFTLGEPAESFRKALSDSIAEGRTLIVANLEEVTYIDTAGIGELVSGSVTLKLAGGQFRLLNPTKRTRDIVTITRFHTHFAILNDEAAAIRSFLK